jgi:hypothetical protein
MGRAQMMRIGPSNLDNFACFGLFSVGFGGIKSDLEERNAAFFANPAQSNARIKLFGLGAGNHDWIIGSAGHQLSEVLNRHGITHEFHESEGGHIWINWRRYLHDFLPRLFPDEYLKLCDAFKRLVGSYVSINFDGDKSQDHLMDGIIQ